MNVYEKLKLVVHKEKHIGRAIPSGCQPRYVLLCLSVDAEDKFVVNSLSLIVCFLVFLTGDGF